MKNNRLGILLILSSLLVIGILLALSIAKQRESKLDAIRVQGVGITRSLSMLPLDVLVPQQRSAGILPSLLVSHQQSDLAYGVVATHDGKALAEVGSPGVIAPQLPMPVAQSSLYGERIVALPHADKLVREFYGPVMKDGQVAAFIRIGYFEPHGMVGGKELSFLALLALPTFLLVPFVYFLIKREMKPLRAIHERLHSMHAAGEARAGRPMNAAPGDISVFAQRLDRYVNQMHGRIEDLENEKVSLLTGNRLLQYNSNKLNFVLNSLPDGLLILDPAGNVNFASAKVRLLFGIQDDSMLTQPVETWCAEERFRNLLLRYQASGMNGMRQEMIEFVPENMPDKRIRATFHPLLPPQEGIVFGTLIVLRDVTREHLEVQSGHDFVAQVSHELKAPLNVIAMYCETLQDCGADDPRLRIEAVNVIHDEAERMAALVNNLLNISKMETGGLQPQCSRVKLDELLQDVFDNLLPRAEAAGIAMEMQLSRELGTAQVDKEMLRIAINNLLTNALKYSDAGGKVTLQATQEQGGAIITVRDTGIGIPPEAQAHVFEKFFRAQGDDMQARSGHGLGLYLTNEIVRLHHGHITLESQPGRGSAFSIHLKKSPALVQEMNVL